MDLSLFQNTEDENLQKNVEQAETQLFEEQDENQTDGQNELGSCTPTLHQVFHCFVIRENCNWVSKIILDCLSFASLLSETGPKISQHSLNQSELKLKPVMTWPLLFLLRIRQCKCFFLEFSLASRSNSGFCFMAINRSAFLRQGSKLLFEEPFIIKLAVVWYCQSCNFSPKYLVVWKLNYDWKVRYSRSEIINQNTSCYKFFVNKQTTSFNPVITCRFTLAINFAS